MASASTIDSLEALHEAAIQRLVADPTDENLDRLITIQNLIIRGNARLDTPPAAPNWRDRVAEILKSDDTQDQP